MILIFFIIYFLACFLLPSIRVYKRTGISPITFTSSENAHDLIGRYMKVIMAIILISALEASHFISADLSVIFTNQIAQIIGAGLMITSLIWTIIAQFQMENSWRIGIDENHKTELKRVGLFKYSRNPIFLGMMTALLGAWLYHATYLNLTLLIISYLIISIQIRLEEKFLLKQHKENYSDFKKSTPRWLLF